MPEDEQLVACDDRRTLSVALRTCRDFHVEIAVSSDGITLISCIMGWINRSWAWSLFATGIPGEHTCDGPQALPPPATMRVDRRAELDEQASPSPISQMWSDFWTTLKENDVILVHRFHSFRAVSLDFSRHRFPEPVGPGPHFMFAPLDLPKVEVTFFSEQRDGIDVTVAVIGPLRDGGIVSEVFVPFDDRPRMTDMREVARILVSMLPPLPQESRN